MTEHDHHHNAAIVRTSEHLSGGFIEAWRQADSDQWFLTWRPDGESHSDYPEQTYTADAAEVKNDRDELLAWARKKFAESGE